MRAEFLLMCLVQNVEKIVRKVPEGTVSLPRKHGKLSKEALLGYREEQLTLVAAEVYNHALMANRSSRKETPCSPCQGVSRNGNNYVSASG